MARDHGRIRTRIWANREFRKLTGDAQRIYFVALSQPSMSHAGIVPYQPRRWASLASDTNQAKVRRAVEQLEVAEFVACDEDTEEMYLRNFVKHDGVMGQPNVVTAMTRAFATVLSDKCRAAFLADLHALYYAEHANERWRTSWERVDHLLSEPISEPFSEPFADPSTRVRGFPIPLPEPSPYPGEVAS